jgi:type IV pilus assembly protein PilW
VNYAAAINWADATDRMTPSNRGDGSPDGSFVHCSVAAPCTADQLVNVVAVKLYVLARSTEVSPGHTDTRTYNLGSATLGPFNDHYKRHAFSTTVRLTNVTGRRETP